MSKISKAILIGLFAVLMTVIIEFIDPFKNLPFKTFLDIFIPVSLILLFGSFLEKKSTKSDTEKKE